MFSASKQEVANRGVPPDSFLRQLVIWAKFAPSVTFATRPDSIAPDDVYNLIKPVLGPWESFDHRRAALVETMRVLAGFESSWKWNEGADVTNPSENNPETMSAGAFQCSWNSRSFGQDMKDLAAAHEIHGGVKFQSETKADHGFAMQWCGQLVRHTCQHHGPLKRGEVLEYLKRDSVAEFQALIAA